MTRSLSYRSRSALATNAVAKKMLCLMELKRSNLCVGVDLTTAKEVLDLAELLGPEICLFKTHIDMVSDFSLEMIHSLKLIAERHKFLIFEDRKFADIGNTTKLQYEKGVYHISEWADIVNVHPLPGPGVIEALKEGITEKERGILLIAQMSCKNNLITDDYTQACVQLAKHYKECVAGYICQERIDDSLGVLHMVPGVRFSIKEDKLGQHYITPDQAIKNGGDLIIVGCGITAAEDPLKEAQRYRHTAWETYENLIAESSILN